MAEIPGYRPSVPPPGPQQSVPLDTGGEVTLGRTKRRVLASLLGGIEQLGGKLLQSKMTNDLAHAELYTKEQRNALREGLRDSSYENWEVMHQQASGKIRDDALKLLTIPATQEAFLKWYESSDEDLRFAIAGDAKTLARSEEKLKAVELMDGLSEMGDESVGEIQRIVATHRATGLFSPEEAAGLGQQYQRKAVLSGARRRAESVPAEQAIAYLMDRANEPDLADADRQSLIRDIRDRKTWEDATAKAEAKEKSWTAFEKLYSQIQNGDISTYSQIDETPDLLFEDKLRADAYRRAWLSDQQQEGKRLGSAEAVDFAQAKQIAMTQVTGKTLSTEYVQDFNTRWGQTDEGNQFVRYLETQLGQINTWRKQRIEERARADATKKTGDAYQEEFHTRFYRENQTPEGLRETRQWIRDNYGPSADAPAVPRIGNDKKQTWEGMIDREIKRLESTEYKAQRAEIERGRKTISGFYEDDIREAAKGGNKGAYRKILEERDKLLEAFDAKAEQAQDIDALVNLVMEPPRRKKVRDELTGKRRKETDAEYYRRIGLPELAPSGAPPLIGRQGGEVAAPSRPLPTATPERIASEAEDRQIVARFAGFRQQNGRLALVQVGEQLQGYDNTQRRWVVVDEQAVRAYYLALQRLEE